MDKRNLRAAKPILKAVFDERSKEFVSEFGAGVTDEEVYVSIVLSVEAMADKLGISRDEAWNKLEIYHKGRTQK